MVAAEKAEKLQLAKNKEKLIDDLMFSEGDADAIVADHQTKIAQVRQLLPLLFVFLIPPTGQRLKSPPQHRRISFVSQCVSQLFSNFLDVPTIFAGRS